MENENNSPLIGRNPIVRMVSLGDSVRSIDEENKNVVNFLSESIEKMKIMDMNFDV